MSNVNEVIANMVEVEVTGDDGFRKVKETLTRMGVPSNKSKTLYQSVHILHKRGKYYLCHFKELFALDGRDSTLNQIDISRRNRIAKMLSEWGLLEIVREDELLLIGKPCLVKVLKYTEVPEWNLEAKYAIGNNKH